MKRKELLVWTRKVSQIERKAVIRNRYNYPTPPITDIKGKETKTLNNWTIMETSLAESQTELNSHSGQMAIQNKKM